mmetsp:Transcript_50421/g.109616  ORF Transcript_50421/g.109616 Transcript_50421/m.109616 type:complete len:81 (+) Transcript_50421:51-293(+)|eukprot:CAMPEP_0175917626 /NCGR_PEP_ID=MMETSP0108-20121206/11459_1 /TAXON_ID=195067 ORGANISM="Goniomonas pacifica, Strain CCMP1869" /NCGR_SAMPLE_ID=MMETSP0108 /ASSEMBLY_ACC=CAM_ASM_000204 /LENGTH=80 /DNA_ID=CAMNT_0017240215 /DNA_START=12 /DNA_END=254 /DNA_ORIENTATION=+
MFTLLPAAATTNSFSAGYSAGYKTALKDNGQGGKSYQAAYRTGMQAGMLQVQRKLQFLDSMRRAKLAYNAAQGGLGYTPT